MTKEWRKRSKYSEQFKKRLVRQIIEDGYTPLEIVRRHDIGSSSIYRWLEKYEDEINGNFELNQAKGSMSSPQKDQKKESDKNPHKETNSSRIEELEEELRIERLKRKAYQQMIKIAEERFKISIKKKYGTKQSDK